MTKYVDIDAVKEAVRMAECDADYDGRRFDAEFIENALDFIPAADVATVVHGRKIEDGDIGCFWLCSLCGECLPYGANYCPNCGAKMDGGDGDAAD